MRPAHAIITAALAASVVASCWQPAFDPELSASSLTSSKMKLVSTITVTDMQQYRATSGLFLPRRVARPTDGIWISGWGTEPYPYESITPLYVTTASYYTLKSGSGFSPIRTMPPTVSMSPDGTLEALAFSMKTSPDAMTATRLFTDAMPVASSIINLAETVPPFAGAVSALGAGYAAEPGLDTGFVIYRDTTTGFYHAVEFPYSSGNPTFLAPDTINVPSGLDPAGVGFAACKGNSWYVSLTEENGAIRTFRWTNNLAAIPVELTSIKAPLVAILNAAPGGTPTLLSSNGMSMTVYDENGTELYSFPAGSLRFVHERWDAAAGAWMAVFCRTIFIRSEKNDNGTLRTEVFEIPVSELSSLRS